ncbi:Digestive cysteine proteinase 3 [Amphibalanus amphitrite]|uniref:Digestive cysteine proteinase 3 n=1 Tax=Amphibalanus amphitrite TaxID=1232801 RepID=A0A6A4X6M2_AMPAM|nr:Digestive cysteine proteinase 3 [Amphibalanus amphitrite]
MSARCAGTAVLLAAVLLDVTSATLPDPAEWDGYKAAHGKRYGSLQEELRRMRVYADSKAFVARHNAEFAAGRQTFTVALNRFADLTRDEVNALYSGLRARRRGPGPAAGTRRARRPSEPEPPAAVDWRERGVVTPVKDQGQCGSCWAFSSTGAIESAWALAGRGLRALSEQQLVDCSAEFFNHGCSGGTMDQAFRYVEASGGLMSEEAYPYTAADGGACRAQPSGAAANITGHVDVMAAGAEPVLAAALAAVGPISVSIDASQRSFQLYAGGVYSESACSSIWLDHGVLAVGYGAENGTAFWLVKNSWGAEWGEQGYIRMVRDGTNQCGIASEAVYPVV